MSQRELKIISIIRTDILQCTKYNSETVTLIPTSKHRLYFIHVSVSDIKFIISLSD